MKFNIFFYAKIFGFLISIYFIKLLSSCQNKPVYENEQKASSEKTLNTFSCQAHINSGKDNYKPFIEIAFQHYGAFLLYYQQQIKALGQTQAKNAILKIHSIMFDNSLAGNNYPSIYFGYDLKNAINKADSELSDESLKSYWKNWCEHPGEFFSWMTPSCPSMDPQKGNMDSVICKSDFDPKKLGIAFTDDGIAFFRSITGIHGPENACFDAVPNFTVWREKT
jgi:hypothetical protein